MQHDLRRAVVRTRTVAAGMRSDLHAGDRMLWDAEHSAAPDHDIVDGGRFEIEVLPGSFLLTASIEEDPARSVIPTRVQVVAGTVSRANVLVDSGIR